MTHLKIAFIMFMICNGGGEFLENRERIKISVASGLKGLNHTSYSAFQDSLVNPCNFLWPL